MCVCVCVCEKCEVPGVRGVCERCDGASSTLRWGERMMSLPPTDWPVLSVSGEEEERRRLRW